MNQNEEKALNLLRQWQSATKTFYDYMESAKYTDSWQAREREEKRASAAREAAWSVLKQLEKVEL